MEPKTLLLKFLLAGILLGSQHFADCATFYVSPSGSDSAVGSQSAPWKRIQKGLGAAQPGDTIRLLPGIHYPGGELWTGRSGTAALPITILGQPDNTAVIAGGSTKGQDFIRIKHAYYIVKNLKWDGYGIQFLGPNSHHNIVEANTITNAFRGVDFDGSTDPTHKNGPNNNTVRNNVVTHWKSDGGIKLAGHDNLISSNRLEFNDGWDATRAFGYGHRIQDNLFKGIKSDPGGNHVDIIQSFGTNGSVAYDIIFERNTLIDCSGQFANLEANGVADQRHWVFRNNLTINSRIQMNIIIPECEFYNNTFYRGTHAVGISLNNERRGVANKTKIKNNIFFECGTNESNGVYGDPLAKGLTGCEVSHNMVVWMNGSPKDMRWTEPGRINGGNPKFADPANNNFRLLSGSPALGSGIQVAGVDVDMESQLRVVPFDRGCYTKSAALSPPTDLRIATP
ncbi:MAG: hypothetical protein H0W28_10915 [Pyrinomonadaceae bacterium]|nr:hypothetical protein [Pyrinomonadaceae bacterium]